MEVIAAERRSKLVGCKRRTPAACVCRPPFLRLACATMASPSRVCHLALAVLVCAAALCLAQTQSTQSTVAYMSSTSLSTETVTETTPVLVASAGNAQLSTTSLLTTVVTTTVPVLVTYTATATTSGTPSATTTPQVLLDTRLDPGFGVLGAVLILTGLPTAFWGHKNRWSSFFIVGFYTLALTACVLIIRFGVINSVNPPSETLRGLFVLSSAVAGLIGGGIAVLVWKLARYAVGAWGGLALGLWIQCFHAGGIIHPIGFRWLFYIGKYDLLRA